MYPFESYFTTFIRYTKHRGIFMTESGQDDNQDVIKPIISVEPVMHVG